MKQAVDLGNAISGPCQDVVPTFTTNNTRILLLMPEGKTSGMLRIEDAERLQGLPEGWTAQYQQLPAGLSREQSRSGIFRDSSGSDGAGSTSDAMAENFSNTKRWEMLGNAVTVPVSRWLGERLAMPYAFKYHVGVGDKRMDSLLITKDRSKGFQQLSTSCHARSATPNGPHEQPLNIWSFVTIDHIQEGIIFSYDKAKASRKPSSGQRFNLFRNDVSEDSLSPLETPLSEEITVIEKEAIVQIVDASNDGNCDEGEAAGDRAFLSHHQRMCGGSIPAPARVDLSETLALENDQGLSTHTRSDRIAVRGGQEVEEERQQHEEEGVEDEEYEETLRHRFQAEIVESARRGRLSKAQRPTQMPWDKDSWPKSAWWVRGLGAFAVPQLSESPILTPLQPLGSFVQGVGRAPTFEEIESKCDSGTVYGNQ